MTRLMTLDGTPMSRQCFGCMQFGGTADRAASHAMFDAASAAGINIFDTAHLYTEGRSETWLGEMIGPRRDALLIATKVGYTGGSGRANILSSFDESRARLGLDMVDILYLHRWDGATPLEETFETLAGLQSSGRIRHIGVSNFAAWQVMKAQGVAQALGTRIDLIQPMYSLVKRQAEVELLPMAAAEGIAVLPYSPLGGGLLTGKYARGDVGRLSTDPRYAARYGLAWMHEAAAGLAALGDELDVDPATLAVAWVMAHEAISAPIVSARSEAQLRPSLAALTYPLSDTLHARISALSPRPAPATDRLEEV
ncbi:aldo/keto reductase [Dinoroseobacter sp. S375]|uniref:aldo/keto reductase n=1 Tax=Dinoroseobacter sp. S375 TaxID=3415136 RepID=UPI003C7D6AAF